MMVAKGGCFLTLTHEIALPCATIPHLTARILVLSPPLAGMDGSPASACDLPHWCRVGF